MKKEKSLLLAVGTSIAALAMVFTISSCSGDNGKDGAPGAPGEPGTGTNGTNGTSCTVEGAGPWTVTCGTAKVIIPINQGNPGESCTMIDGLVTCGNMTVGICGSNTYNPEEDYCSGGSVTPLSKCNGETFNPNKQYCKMKSYAYNDLEIADLCGENEVAANDLGSDTDNGNYDPDKYCQFTSPTATRLADAGSTGTPGTDFCMVGPTATAVKNRFNDGQWEGKYCAETAAAGTKAIGYVCGFEAGIPSSNVVKINESYDAQNYCKAISIADGKVTWGTGADSDKCGTGPRMNENGWKGQYCLSGENTPRTFCGYVAGEQDASTVELAAAYEYCAKIGPGKSDWVASNESCDAANGYSTPTATIPDDKKLNKDAWKAQYCQAKDPEDADYNISTKKYQISSTYCNVGTGEITYTEATAKNYLSARDLVMNEETSGNDYVGEYCQAQNPGYAVTDVWCYEDVDSDPVFLACVYDKTTGGCYKYTSTNDFTGVGSQAVVEVGDIFKINATWTGKGQFCKYEGGITACTGETISLGDGSCADDT